MSGKVHVPIMRIREKNHRRKLAGGLCQEIINKGENTEDIMQRFVVRQIAFFIVLAFSLFFVGGVLIYSNVQAQGLMRNVFQDWEWNDEWDEDLDFGKQKTFDIRYNRVEGLYMGGRVEKDYWRRRYPSRPFFFGFGGYSFHANTVQYQTGLETGFFKDYHLAFGGEYHRMVDTPDHWIIPDMENSLAAFFLKEDFQDFFFREGWSGYISQNVKRSLSMSVTYQYDKLDSLEKKVDWSLFGGKKHFRDNPPMPEGKMRSIVGRWTLDTRNSIKRTTQGWYIEIEAEHAGGKLGGDFQFDRVLMDIRRYQPLGIGEGIDFRLRVGSSHGSLSWQRSYHLGGLSTLRGFPFKVFPAGPMSPGGNRMVLAQLEYRMGSQDLPDELDMGILEYFNLIVFADIGWVADVGGGPTFLKGFDDLSWDALKSDVGIALANRSGNVRIQLARRTDTGKSPFVLSFRLQRAF